jgi:membrane protease YdiL (CAAX protease family)
MTVVAAHARRRVALEPLLLLGAFGSAVVVRVAVAGPSGPGSIRAGLMFAAILAVLAFVSRAGFVVSRRAAIVGAAGAAVLVLPVLVTHGVGGHLAATGYPIWAVATAAVATAEEAFLRGALYDAVARDHGIDAAVVIGAIAFAALHVPLYGWHVVPLDLAVGLVLGALRVWTGTWTAPALAHAGADLIGWWLV